MKKIYCIFLALAALATVTFGQPRAKIVTKAVTPRTVAEFGTNSMSPGLRVVAKGTFSYLSPLNIGDETVITTADWTLISKPAGSTATLTTLPNNWVMFKADTNGTFTVGLHMVTSSGSHDTTINITSSYYVGVGNFEGVAATWPQCMSCHASMPKFQAIFDKWKVSNHAQLFKTEIVITSGGHYSTSCMPCHTTGYDNKVVASNNGFDDIAKTLGWKWTVETAGKWDSLKTYYPTLVNHATIGCENCHGAGKEHGSTTDVSKIQISLDAGVCQSCHDAPWRHSIGTQYEYSVHSEAIWENGFGQGASSQNNSLGNCIRCHDGKGFINFTNNLTTNTTGWNLGNHSVISCQTCHDPHNGDRRVELAIADTLANGYNYGTIGGEGHLCMNCHKARKNSGVVTGNLSSHWGPHGSVQTDVLLGKNVNEFGGTYPSSTHKFALANACVDCHMQTTTDTGTVMRDKVGGHSWNMNYNDGTTDYDHTVKCQSCHGPQITHFTDFIAAADYDGDGTIEALQAEVEGMVYRTKWDLPHIGVGDTIKVDWQSPLFSDLTLRKVWFNMQMIENDGSFGMHNAKFAVAVLQKGIAILENIVPVELVAFNASVSGNNAIVTWETSTETNNKGFDVERKTGKEFVKVAFVNGKGTTTEPSAYSYTDKLNNIPDGKIVYRIKQTDFDGKVTYSKEVTVNYVGGPRTYTLSQNYPNPFNPSTIIKFALPFNSNVKLSVYNVAGQLVKTLVNGLQSSGTHEVNFNLNGLNLSSGIYFYSLEASAVDGNSNFRETKKMILMK